MPSIGRSEAAVAARRGVGGEAHRAALDRSSELVDAQAQRARCRAGADQLATTRRKLVNASL